MRALILLSMLLPQPALAAATLLVAAEGDVRVLIDGAEVGWMASEGWATVLIDQPGRHGVRVERRSGGLLAERNIQLDEGETLALRWDGERLEIDVDIEHGGSESDPRRRPNGMQAAQAASSVASMIAPANPVVSGVSTGLGLASAGGTLMHSAQGALDAAGRGPSTPPATSAHEHHSLEQLERSSFDPYAATGGRPSIDASLASVTFIAGTDTAALVTIDGQPVATLGPGASEATVPVVPGMHRVMIHDASGAELIHSGRLTVTAGWILEIRFSASEPPVSSLPEAWR
jgi:uncharacterized Zn-binding protein involved in type VI secretion